MALEIPSLPSSDLNSMMSLFLKPVMRPTPRGLWPNASSSSTVTVVEDYAEADRSPEPRTPNFGMSSTPTFDESNSQFGFRFPGPVSKSSESAVVSSAVPVTNVSVAVSEAKSNTQSNSQHVVTEAETTVAGPSISANPQTQAVVMEGDQTVGQSSVQYVLVQEPTMSSSDHPPATHTISQEVVPAQMMNIPTTVLDKVGESSKKHKKVDPSELPQIMLSSGDGKPVSFIRFLNDPIPLPVHYEHHELNIDKYRAPVEGNHPTGHPGHVDSRVIADIDAIQKMEQEPVYRHAETYTERETSVDQRVIADTDTIQGMEQQPGYHPDSYSGRVESISDQSVPDQSSGSENSVYYESTSDESSSNSVSPYHNNPDVMINEVAAYQCVDESPTYTELTTRIPPPPTPCPTQETRPFTYTHPTNNTITDSFHQESDNYSIETESMCSHITKLKNSLKNKIQMKRLQQGKGELKVSFENRPIGEPSEEEKQKAETRRQKNRDSAIRSRERRQKLMTDLEKEVKELDRENKRLQREISTLKEENANMLNFDLQLACGCSDAESREATSLTSNVTSQEEDQSLRNAIDALLASEANT